MRTIIMIKLYAVIAIAILGVRLAFEFLSFIELCQFFGAVLIISISGTCLHKFFEYRARKTGLNGLNSPNFVVQMIVLTILVSTGVYFLISYFISGTFSIGFDIVFYVLFIPAIVLFSIWMYSQIIEVEYNHRLQEMKNKKNNA